MYRTLCAELWTDPAIKSLDVPTKLLFVYLITNPHTHLCGIYYLPEETGMRETGLKPIPYRYGIDTLSKLNKAHWDAQTETMFVVNMFAYQGRGTKNYAAAANHIATLHKSVLIQRFLDRYPQLLGIVREKLRYPIDTLSHISPSVPISVSDSDLLTKREKRVREKREATSYPEEFVPNDSCVKLAARLHVNLEAELPQFRDDCLKKGKKWLDWHAAFRTWLRNVPKFAGKSNGSAIPPFPPRTDPIGRNQWRLAYGRPSDHGYSE